MMRLKFKEGPLEGHSCPWHQQVEPGSPFRVPLGRGDLVYLATEDFENGCQVLLFSREEQKVDNLKLLRENLEKSLSDLEKESKARLERSERWLKTLFLVIGGCFVVGTLCSIITNIIRACR